MLQCCRIALSTFVLCALVIMPARGDYQEELEQKDLDRLQGTWEVVSAEHDGHDFTDEFKKNVGRITFQGDAWIPVDSGKQSNSGTTTTAVIKLFPSQSPKGIDQIASIKTSKKNWVTLSVGIYELEGDSLKMCLSRQGRDRPTDFSTKDSDQTYCATFKRVK